MRIWILLMLVIFSESARSVTADETLVFGKPLATWRVTQRFSDSHPGTDLISFSSRKVRNIQRCRVTSIDSTVNGTPRVVCENRRWRIIYMHITTLKDIRYMSVIEQDAMIGSYNNVGKSEGEHLHIEIYNAEGKLMNAEKLLNL